MNLQLNKMKEEYLHYLWQNKRLPFQKFKLTDGRDVDIINVGWLNYDSGPDFFSGNVSINGINWTGNIEIHVKSSDWYAHNHHNDNAYDNVILHVVLEHDKDVYVNDNKLPTIELKDFIDYNHYAKYKKLIRSNLKRPCAKFDVPEDLYKTQIHNALFQRLNRKANWLNQKSELKNDTLKQTLFTSICVAFGGRVNKIPFTTLAQNLDVKILLREAWDMNRVEAILFGVAGLLKNNVDDDSYLELLQKEFQLLKRKYNLYEMDEVAWKFSGVRPPSFPTLKIAQLAALVFNWKLEWSDEFKSTLLSNDLIFKNIEVSEYWKSRYTFGDSGKLRKGTLGKSLMDKLILNGFAPFLYLEAMNTNKFEYVGQVEDLLQNLKAENNYITRSWSNQGIKAEDAGESQGMIELSNEFCNFRRCLSCKVGQFTMQK